MLNPLTRKVMMNGPGGGRNNPGGDEAFLQFCSQLVIETQRRVLRPCDALNEEIPKSRARAENFDVNVDFGNNVLRCTAFHFSQVKQYQRFANALKELETWADDANERIGCIYQDEHGEEKPITEQSAQKLIEIFRQWHAKVSALKSRVDRIAPVKKRQISQSAPIRVKAMCQYNTDGITISEEDELQLVDNSDKINWVIERNDGMKASVPSVFIFIPPPDPTTKNKLNRLEDDLQDCLSIAVESLDKAGHFKLRTSLREIGEDNINGGPVQSPSFPRGGRHKSNKITHRVFEIKAKLVDEVVEEDITTLAGEDESSSSSTTSNKIVISAVTDPRNPEEMLSVAEATALGILDFANGLYIDPISSTMTPIPEAMASGLLVVEAVE
ncbi:uncharacterized protein LOC135494708 [Lineus longissimus]|uniref:uncharacterized protein LOC135494708 n=1 Tax=Lineus longissimus TaxID=88925 RepID=UPI00315DC746